MYKLLIGFQTRQVMTLIRSLLFIFILGFLAACEEKTDIPALVSTDISNPVSYRKSNINFKYPKNWEVTEDGEQNNHRYIFVEGSGAVIITIDIYMKKYAVPLSQYVEKWSVPLEDKIRLLK